MNYQFIAIEGNIGAGKSTLAQLLSQHYNARLILEEFADNNFLPKFYEEPDRYAFPLELSFLADRFKQLKNTLPTPNLFKETIISDYLFIKSKLFAKINLKEDEYDLFQKLFDIIDLHLPPPDLLIYLHSPIRKLQSNIQNRGRSYEQNIKSEYLEKVQDIYLNYLKQHISKTLIIDTSNADFLGDKNHLKSLINFLDQNHDFSTHYLTF